MLARFEKLVEQAVEGSLRRVFPTTVQPVQLAKAAARAMEDAQVIGLHGAEAPNKYELQLAPDDFERFGDYASTLCGEVSRYLADYARDRGLRLVAEPRVELHPDADVRAGSVRAQAPPHASCAVAVRWQPCASRWPGTGTAARPARCVRPG